VATYLAPHVRPVYELAANRIGRALGVPTELVTGHDLEALGTGAEHVAFMCSPPALELTDRDPPAAEIVAAPVLVGADAVDPPVYRSEVIVHADDHARGLEDLEGRSWAYNEEASHSGYGVVLAELAGRGYGPAYFGRIERTGFHGRSIRRVAGGGVDWAAIDEQVLALELRTHPRLRERIRVVDRLGPSPIQPVVVSTVLGAEERAAVVGCLVALGDDPDGHGVLASHLIQGFVRVTGADYAPIRAMWERIRLAGLETVRA
jgi:phosphonate transport system substrate-binding protein